MKNVTPLKGARDLRFGITSLHLDAWSSEGAATDLSSLIGFDHTERVRHLAQQGFACVELNADVGAVLPYTLAPAAVAELEQIKEEHGIAYTVHLPILSVEPASPLQAVRRGAVQAMVEIIRATLPLEPEAYVYHATGDLAARSTRMPVPEMARAFVERAFQNFARESIEAILSETGIPSRQLAIETIQFPFQLTLELAEQLDTSVCFDTAHVLVGYSGPVELFESFEQAAPRLSEVHLNDGPWQGPEHTIHYGKDHLALGCGDLDVGRFVERLQAMRFNGPVVFELPLEDAKNSLALIQRMNTDLMAA
jgi:sugar phosphate isomerase/epimerase